MSDDPSVPAEAGETTASADTPVETAPDAAPVSESAPHDREPHDREPHNRKESDPT